MITLSIWRVKTLLAAEEFYIRDRYDWDERKSNYGVRYLTEYSNGISPISNAGLIYTYQGITSDGKYYVAAVLPVNHPSLPADSTVTGSEPPTFRSNYQQYKTDTARSLNVQAPATFAPDLTLLDAIMSSLKIN